MPIYDPTNNYMGVQVALYPCQYLLFLTFNFSHSDACVVASHGFNLPFPDE